MYSVIELSPAEIRFMQDSISYRFRCGRYVNDAIEKIAKKEMRVDTLPMIQVLKKDGLYYSLDNRRLYVFRVLHYRGLLDSLKVELVPTYKFQDWKFTTKNNGQSLYVRQGKTQKHHEDNSTNIKLVQSCSFHIIYLSPGFSEELGYTYYSNLL